MELYRLPAEKRVAGAAGVGDNDDYRNGDEWKGR